MGKLHCPGQSHISAWLKILANGGNPILCSNPEAVGKTIALIGPCLKIISFN